MKTGTTPSTITCAGAHSLETGDTFSMELLDKRQWKRFVFWLLRRPPPKIRKYFKVTGEISSTSVAVLPKY
jgi:hypothetical protein